MYKTVTFLGGKDAGPQKTGRQVWAPPPHPQDSAEPLGFCRKVLQKVSHSKKPVEETFRRTPKVLQNFGSQTQLFRPCNLYWGGKMYRKAKPREDGLLETIFGDPPKMVSEEVT